MSSSRDPPPGNEKCRPGQEAASSQSGNRNTDTLKRIDPKAQPAQPSLYEMAQAFLPNGPFFLWQYYPIEIVRCHEEGEIIYECDEFAMRRMYWRAMAWMYFGDLSPHQNTHAVLFDREDKPTGSPVPWRVSQIQPHVAAAWAVEGEA
jgi:hypothetical protein